MCSTIEGLNQEVFYGPTGRNNWADPVRAHRLEPYAKDHAVSKNAGMFQKEKQV
jgi:hypothetical protein